MLQNAAYVIIVHGGDNGGNILGTFLIVRAETALINIIGFLQRHIADRRKVCVYAQTFQQNGLCACVNCGGGKSVALPKLPGERNVAG